MLQEGDKAPNFKALNQKGELVKLSDFKGKKLVLFFYPKDSTSTCTVEACNLRDNYQELLDAGFVLLGVSPDSAKSHQKFIDKNNLPFDLLVDEEKLMVTDYEVWAEKMLYGRKYMGVLRTTFLIDKTGIINRIITKVDSKNHSEQIITL
jgi:peroxiredoxin Q/BCP